MASGEPPTSPPAADTDASPGPHPGPHPDPQPPRGKKFLPRCLRLVLALAFAGVFVYFVGRAGIELWGEASAAAVVPGGVALAATVVLTTLWLAAMEAIFALGLRHWMPGVTVPRRPAAAVFFQSHLARYVPGKVMQVGTLAGGLVKLGCSGRQAAGAVVMHQFNFILSTAAFALLLAPLLWRASFNRGGVALPAAAGAIVVALVLLWVVQPRWLRHRIERLIPKLQRSGDASASTIPGRAFVFTAYLALTAAQAVTVAPLAMDLAGNADPPLDTWNWIALCGAYPVARLIGQLGVAAPGGLGVREGAYVVLVLPLVGGPAGAAIAAWARLCAIVSELLAYAVATLLARPHCRASSTDKSPTRRGSRK